MAWTKILPAGARLAVQITETDASHKQAVRIQVEGEPKYDLYEGSRPYIVNPGNYPRKVVIQPWSVSDFNADSRYESTETRPGALWNFICDDGPGGDSDFNDLKFTVEFGEELRGYIKEIYGDVCGRQNSRSFYFRNLHPSAALKVFIDYYNLARPLDRHRKLERIIRPSLTPGAPKPLPEDVLMGCPQPEFTFDNFRWKVLDVQRVIR